MAPGRADRVDLHVVSPDEWEKHRALRLEMLLDSPDAFWTTHAEAAAMDEAQWLQRISAIFTVMATLDGEPVGSVGLWGGSEPDPEVAFLIAMYVAPHARGLRVGERLVTAVQDEAVRQGRRRVHLEVTSSNAPAIGLYERRGFVFTGVTTPHPRRDGLVERAMVWTALGYRSGDSHAKVGPMSDVAVRPLGEDDWQDFRGIRLEALAESPDAFASGYTEEEAYDEDFWRLRLRRSARLVAEAPDGRLLGLVNVGQASGEEGPVPEVAEIFGLWVRPEARGTGVATMLVEASAKRARADGKSHIAYWVGTDNGRAVAFASGMGFRPTDYRRAMRSPSGEESGEQEIAMVLPLGADRGTSFRL